MIEEKKENYRRVPIVPQIEPINRSDWVTCTEEGDVVWHDLRRNPEDLPEEKKTVLCLTDVLTVTAQYDKKLEGFFRLDKGLDYCILVATVYAWCEIPKFEREV